MNILDIAIAKQLAGGGGSGTDNYNELSNLPKINGTTLSGDKSSSSLGLQSEIKEGAELASDLVDDTGQDNKFVTSAEKLEWSGKQNLIDSSHKLSSDLVDDTNKTNKFVTSTEKNTWNAKQNAIDADHKLSSDLVDDTNKTNKFVTSTEKNTWNAKQNAIDSEHKLSSSLVRFSEAEAAALASGINSTKVGQISTNQTNILYAINTGVKNFANAQAPTQVKTGLIATNLDNGAVKLSATSQSWTAYYIGNTKVLPNTEYVISVYADSITNAPNFWFSVFDTDTTGTVLVSNKRITSTGETSATFTSISDTLIINVYPNNSATALTTDVTIRIMLCAKSVYDQDPSYQTYALPNYDLTRMVSELQKKAVKVYTYHVNPNESDPEDAVTYLDDATGLTPAKMSASSFSYGSWANAWFLPRPCVLKFDGTVDYYLNPNDYSKKTDGTASTIDSSNSTGNVMLEFPKIWVKRVNDGNGARTVSIAPVNVDGTYKCWSNINAEDKEVDHFYLPAYNGTIHSSKMRSLSGVTLNSTYAPNYTRAQEVTAATANNPTGKNMWYTETWADMCLVYDLLYLMGKSLDVQRTFGQGFSSGSETDMRAYVTGAHNAKGLFYGDISGTSTAVKALGMENLWGCRWHAVAGLINDSGTLKVKMTYGVADGSTAVGYNTTGSGYLNYGSTYGTAGYVKKMQADNTMGYKIIETAGTDATYYCDYYYANNSQSNYALLGGASGDDAGCGFCVDLADGAAYTNWSVVGSLSCRP